MKKIIFRLTVVFLGQLCCVAIGLSSGALNLNNLQAKARSERVTATAADVPTPLRNSPSGDPPPADAEARHLK